MKSLILLFVSLLSPPAFGEDLTAVCEAFVDKIQVQTPSDSSGHVTMRLFLKVNPGLLDAPIARVAVHHQRQERWGRRLIENDWRFDELSALPGIGSYYNYYSYEASVGNWWADAREQVAFVITTTRGTKYWVNAANHPGWYFQLTQMAVRSLSRDRLGSVRPDLGVHNADLASVSPTADYPDDLAYTYNRLRCRG